MKKVLWLIVCLMTMVMSANAQSNDEMNVGEWYTKTIVGDELKGTENEN